MHVLQLVPRLELGGVERGVLDVARGLISRGHQVSVVSSGGTLVDSLAQLGAMHYTLPIDRKSPLSVLRCLPAVCELVHAAKIDLIHARSRAPAWIGYLAARRTERSFVTTCHGFYKPHPASCVMTWGRLVIVPSQALARYLIDQFRLPPERLRVIPRGVDLAQFRFRKPFPHGDGPWRIGLIGRISALKGHGVAIRALHELIRQGLAVRLCVIGDSPADKPSLRQRFQQLAEALGVAHAIEWLGMRKDIPECAASLDVVVAPSTYPESFGRSVIEAQAVGIPVVASRIGAFAEVIEDGTTGVLVRPGDHAALANGISRLIQDERLRNRIAYEARRRVEGEFKLERMVDETLDVYNECLTRPRIVVWKLSALGDLVLASPSLRAIRQQFPASLISLVVGRRVYEAVAGCPYVNEILIFDSTRKARTLAGTLRFVRRLKRAGFDRSLDLQNNRLTHLLAWLAGVPVRIGYGRKWGWLLNRAVPPPQAAMDPVSHQQVLLRHAGIAPDGSALELWPSKLDEQQAERLLGALAVDATKPLVGIHPGGSERWQTKRWDLTRWAAVCDRLAAQGIQVVVTGSAQERRYAEELANLTAYRPFVAVGQTSLMELACLIRCFGVFVTGDSAPLHIAVAMRIPTVCLFGPTDPARHVPCAPSVRVIAKKVFCSPCYSTWCRTITHACMKRITVDEVLQAIAECGMPNAELRPITPHSALRTPDSP